MLTAEVLSPLSYLPRDQFLGEVLRAVHGANDACAGAASEIECAELTLLPEQYLLLPGSEVVVQPDATMATPGHVVLVEAKRIRTASFQREQLAREYVTVLHEAADRVPLLLLVLGTPPPVAVKVTVASLRPGSDHRLVTSTPPPSDELEPGMSAAPQGSRDACGVSPQ